jgi:hypothetical protein
MKAELKNLSHNHKTSANNHHNHNQNLHAFQNHSSNSSNNL